jgi:hypothetical protein
MLKKSRRLGLPLELETGAVVEPAARDDWSVETGYREPVSTEIDWKKLGLPEPIPPRSS